MALFTPQQRTVTRAQSRAESRPKSAMAGRTGAAVCAPRSLASQLFREMDQESSGVLELDMIKQLLSRLSDSSFRLRVEKLLHEHVFEQGSFVISRDAFISKWERMYLEQGRRKEVQKRYDPPHVLVKLNDLRPPSVLQNPEPAPAQASRLDQNQLVHIMRQRLQKLEQLADAQPSAPKFIGKGKSGSQKAANLSACEEPDLIEIRRRILNLQRVAK